MTSNVNLAEADSINAAIAAAAGAMKSGEYDVAMDRLKSVLEEDPGHELVNGMLGSIYAELGMPDKAIAFFQQTLVTNSGNPLARFQLGLVLLTSQRHQDAIETLAPMLSDEEDFLAHFHSAVALMALHRNSEARSLLLIAQQRMPSSHPLFNNLQRLLEQSE